MDSGQDIETKCDLKKDPSTSTPGEKDDSATTGPQLNHSPSSSSSSSSSDSSSQDCFQLGENETPTSPLGSIVSAADDEDNDSTSLKSEPNQKLPNVGHGNVSSTSIDSRTIATATATSTEAAVSTSASECSPKVTFKINGRELEDSQVAPKIQDDEEIRVSSRPTSVQWSNELAGSQSRPGSNSLTKFPPPQVMERPGDSNSSGYRIPSYVFARTKSTAPMEWSTASNESLFSIHMGNMSFNRDQLLWLGKSGELGKPGELTMSGPLMDLSSYQPPLSSNNNKSAQSSQNSSQVLEAKAAETMREVIRESAENRDKEDDASSPVKEGYPSSKISRQPDESAKSFAFPM